MGLSDDLRTQAISLGLCKKWQREWGGDTDVDDLLDKYVRGIDFCIAHNWPDIDFIKENFRPDELHKHNIYVDEEVFIDSVNGPVILLGHCVGRITTIYYDVADIYVLHDSDFHFDALDNSKMYLNISESASIKTRRDRFAEIYKYNINVGEDGEL